jgi:peptidoglycan hydrolase-like protein with peptidoglycan-binding domain
VTEIVFPLTGGMQGPTVAALQDALQLCLDRGVMLPTDAARRDLSLRLQLERATQLYGDATRSAVAAFQSARGLADPARGPTGAVDSPTAEALDALLRGWGVLDASTAPAAGSGPQGFTVSGHVRDADGRPVRGAIVTAADRDLRAEEPLGQATTGGDGRYEIRYDADQFSRAEKGTADLVVRAHDASGAALAESPTLFNADPQATIDLVVPRTAAGLPSEYERLVAELAPLLVDAAVPGSPAAVAGVPAAPTPAIDPLASLGASDVDFLASETGLDRQRIALLVGSAGLRQQAGRAGLDVPTEAFYGLGREDLPLDLAALGARSQRERSDALSRAIADRVVPATLREKLPAVLDQLQRLVVGEALRRAPGVGPSIGDVLGTALASPQQQATLLALAADHAGPAEDFWKTLRADPAFQQPGVVDRLQLTMQLALLTGNHLPLVRQLQQKAEVASPRDLVALDAPAWTELVRGQVDGKLVGAPPGVPGVPGATPDEQTANYVNGIMGTLRAVFPTDTVARVVVPADARLDASTRQAVSRFFANAPDFDIRSTRVEDYAARHAGALDGIAPADRTAVLGQVKRLQRAFLVSTSADTMGALLAAGLDSAHAIASIPRASFVGQYQAGLGGPAQARAVHDRALAIENRTLQVYAYVNDALKGAHPAALGIDGAKIEAAVGKYIPNYGDLFGSLDLCACDACRSVLSPAAYLVDLLEFLRHSTPNAQKRTPLDVLLARRPDLSALPLTCENTNTTLPYVDLVNEVLESYVAVGKPDPSASHDTGDATAQELDANPQFTLAQAYEILAGEVYPFSLPFHQPLETARVYLQHLGTSRHELMRTFQPAPSAETARAEAAEYLSMTPEEYRVVTGADLDPAVTVSPRPVREMYGYAADQITRSVNNAPTTKSWKDWLADVPELLQRTGLAYAEVVELVKARFVNPAYPQGAALDLLGRIPIGFAALANLVQSKFASPKQEVLDALANAGITLQQLQDWCNANFAPLSKLVVLDAPGAGCDLDHTRLQHLDGTLLDDGELDALHRFVRTWRRSGWSIADLDSVLGGLQAKAFTPDVLAALSQVAQLRQELQADVRILASLWSPIGTRGPGSLYEQLFLGKAALAVDDAFVPDPKNGSVLTNATVHLSDHLPALLKALRISAADLAAIRTATKLDGDGAPLSLDAVSALHRHAALARALKLRVGDLVALKTLSGIDPFASPAQTLAFADVAARVQRSRLPVALLNYLCRHLTAPPANLAPQPTTVHLLARTLRDGLVQIAQGDAPAPDPSGEPSRAKLALIFDAATVDSIARMIDGTAVYSSSLAALPPKIAFPDAVSGKVAFDAGAKQLRFTGAMTAAERTALLGAASDAGYQAAVDDLYAQPAAVIRNALSGFLDVQDAEKNLLRDVASLDPALRPVLLDAKGVPTVDPSTAVTTAIARKFAYLLEGLLPYLRDRLSRALAKQTVAEALKLDAATAELLLETVLRSPADPKRPAIADLLALVTQGLSAEYFTTANLTGTPSTATTAATAVVPSGTGSARWRATLIAPSGGAFTFSVLGGGVPQLWLGDVAQPVALQLDATTKAMVSAPVTLPAGVFVPVRLEVAQLPNVATVELAWQGPTVPGAAIPVEQLIPGAVMDALATGFTRLQKAALVANTFALSEGELAYLSDHPKDFAGFDLNALPLAPDDGGAPAAFAALARVADYAALRDGLPKGQVGLVDVFGATSLDDAKARLAQATGWDPLLVAALADGLALGAADLKTEIWPARLQGCVGLVKRIGASAAQLLDWARPSTDYAALAGIAQDVKKAARARHDDQDWLAVAKPLTDRLREAQRGALVAYLLPRLGLSDSNQLLESFLIDVEMSACMETSRVKQAISSVQLFVQRCLMNLEPEVGPGQIDATPWEWMKRYRVWEANRKVFLYPENWIEPELRDDKSPFFAELETELLQSDVTSDGAEAALSNFLQKVDEVGHLEICGTHWEDVDPVTGEPRGILHVFGRTPNTPHVHYYRRLLGDGTWTAWEKVQLDVDADVLTPIAWNGRTYLFWPTFAESGDAKSQPQFDASLAWSEYRDGRWSPKQVSNEDQALDLHVTPDGIRLEPALDPDALAMSFTLAPGWSLDGAGRLLATRTVLGLMDLPASNAAARRAPFQSPTVEKDGILVYTNFASILYRTLGSTAMPSAILDVPDTSAARLQPPLPFATSSPFFFFEDGGKAYCVRWSETFGPVEQVSKKPDALAPPLVLSLGGALGQGQSVVSATQGQSAVVSTGPQSSWVSQPALRPLLRLDLTFDFSIHYHPFVSEFMRSMRRGGTAGLLTPDSQALHEIDVLSAGNKVALLGTVFEREYKPRDRVARPYPFEDVDFGPTGAYALYNWELFFHAPMLVATRLGKSQRFEDAERWFRFVFDPTDGSGRFWKVLPFTTAEPDRIDELLALLGTADDALDPDQLAKKASVTQQLEALRQHPFQPHLIARMRPGAYMKNVFMKYLDNLIAWGDQLFAQNTIESINEATQLYVLAADLLGPRPQRIPPRGKVAALSYADLKDKLDAFSDALVSLENDFPFSSAAASSGDDGGGGLLGVFRTPYFCVPPNDKLLGYWRTVADRLFKIRNCMNIEGATRELPLFEPPIDPALLVTAVARGVDLGSVLNDLGAPLPYHRFAGVLQRALEACAEVKALGASLLAALEKRDAESLSVLRASQETQMLRDNVRRIREQQIEDATESLEALKRGKDVVQERVSYYSALEYMNAGEAAQLTLTEISAFLQAAGQIVDLAASGAEATPDAFLGALAAGMATGAFSFTQVAGGVKAAGALASFGHSLGMLASFLNTQGWMAGTLGGYQRRSEEWAFQTQLAQRELAQIDRQIAAAEVRQQIARWELENHDRQSDDAQQVEDFLRGKYTSEELYGWLQGELSALHFQCYQLAYDLAKKAERAYRFERGLSQSSFVQFGYWDSLRKGLLAGERLHLALKQLERAYLDQDRRDYELTKNVSLLLNDPLALIALKETGRCEIELPEALFDADHPGHYLRRIKTVSVSVPCVVGPYTNVNCTLTLLSDKTRVASVIGGGYGETQDGDDPRFVARFAPLQSIATSHGQNDSGTFELSFRDERYLPFEGAGVISRWRIEMLPDCNAFDLDTVSDVVLHLSYTARDGGEILRNAARKALKDLLADDQNAPRARLISLKHEAPTRWYRFLHPTGGASLELDLVQERFPFQLRGTKLTIDELRLFLKPSGDTQNLDLKIAVGTKDIQALDDPQVAPQPLASAELSSASTLAGVPVFTIPGLSIGVPVTLVLSAAAKDVAALVSSGRVEDIWILCRYSIA